MEAIITVANFFVILAIAAWFYRRYAISQPVLYWLSLSLKLCCGLFLGWLYSSYYASSDTFHYFNDSVLLADLARTDIAGFVDIVFSGDPDRPSAIGMINQEARSVFFVKVLSIVSLITGDNYWISSLYLSLLSFCSAYYLYKTIVQNYPALKMPGAIALLIFPSCVLWSSGIIKEALGMTCLYFITALVIQLWNRHYKFVFQFPMLLLMVIVLWKVRYFYAGLFIPSILSAWIIYWISGKREMKPVVQIISFILLLAVSGLIVTLLHPNFALDKFLTVVVNNNADYMKLSSPHDVIHFYSLEPTWSSVLINAPQAFFSGMFRPFVWEAENVWQAAAGVENLLIILLTVLSISGAGKMVNSSHRLLALAILAYVFLLCIFLAISTPNFGSLSRYRVGFLPFYLIFIMDHPVVHRMGDKIKARFSINLFQ